MTFLGYAQVLIWGYNLLSAFLKRPARQLPSLASTLALSCKKLEASPVCLPASIAAIKCREFTLKSILVGNLSFETTEETVRTVFATYGTVGQVTVVTDRETGQPRGFGYVEMPNDGEGEKAIAAVNGREVDGRRLSVNQARPKLERPAA